MTKKVKTDIGCYFLLPDLKSRGHPIYIPGAFIGYIHGYLLVYLDVNRERVPLDAASFQKENLKKVTPIVNDQVQRESSILVSNPNSGYPIHKPIISMSSDHHRAPFNTIV